MKCEECIYFSENRDREVFPQKCEHKNYILLNTNAEKINNFNDCSIGILNINKA